MTAWRDAMNLKLASVLAVLILVSLPYTKILLTLVLVAWIIGGVWTYRRYREACKGRQL